MSCLTCNAWPRCVIFKQESNHCNSHHIEPHSRESSARRGSSCSCRPKPNRVRSRLPIVPRGFCHSKHTRKISIMARLTASSLQPGRQSCAAVIDGDSPGWPPSGLVRLDALARRQLPRSMWQTGNPSASNHMSQRCCRARGSPRGGWCVQQHLTVLWLIRKGPTASTGMGVCT